MLSPVQTTITASTRGLSYESTLEPEDNGGQNEHGAVIEGTLLVAGGHPAPLLEPIDAALDHVASRVGCLVEDQRTPRSSGSLRALVAPLWNGVLDLSLPQPAPTPCIAVPFVGDEVIWTRPGSPTSCGAWDPDALQNWYQLRTVMALSWSDHNGEGPPAPVTGEVKLGG